MKKSTWILIVCLIGLGGFLPAQRSSGFHFLNPEDRTTTIPIEVHNNLILIEVSINGSFPFKFILDTGVRTTLLTEPVLARVMSMQNTVPIRVLGLGEGEVIHAKKAFGLRMQVGSVVGENLQMIILPDGAVSYSGMFGKPVVGIIGYDFFKSFILN